jgi:hypothetical protein
VNQNPVWAIQDDKPFQHPAIVDTIRDAYFQTPTSIGYRATKEYNSGLDLGKTKLCLPPSLVALAATGVSPCLISSDSTLTRALFGFQVHAALKEWAPGTHQRGKLDGNIYTTVYRDHMNTLEHIKTETNEGYYDILATLHNLVSYVITCVAMNHLLSILIGHRLHQPNPLKLDQPVSVRR